jgi:UPF0755 protein
MATPADGDPRRPNGYKRTGRYGRGPGDQRRFEKYGDRRGAGGLIRFVVFLALMAVAVLLVMVTVARPLTRAIVVPWVDGNPSALRVGFVADLYRESLGEELTAPAGTNPATIEFTVEDGDTPATLASRLLEEGIITSERAFLYEAAMSGLAGNLDAGDYRLAGNLTPAEVVTGLVENRIVIQALDVTFREGIRLEQITAKLQTLEDSGVDPQEFYRLATKPTDEILGDFPWLLDTKVRPKGATLEGFLYPATYTLRTDSTQPTTAEGLLRMMLKAFYDNVGPDRLAVPEKRGLSFFEVLTLASIVEREAVLDDERPLIAGVYQNRIDRKPSVKHGLLQADPTVIYAVDTVNLGKYSEDWKGYTFWTVPEGGMDQQLPEKLAGFNTYEVQGLPPGPIVTPSLASLDAALKPDTKAGYTYFLAIPDGGGAHDFSKTLAEHDRKRKKYGY